MGEKYRITISLTLFELLHNVVSARLNFPAAKLKFIVVPRSQKSDSLSCEGSSKWTEVLFLVTTCHHLLLCYLSQFGSNNVLHMGVRVRILVEEKLLNTKHAAVH